MDDPVTPAARAADLPGPFQPILYDIARVLAESPTLAEAAPRLSAKEVPDAID